MKVEIIRADSGAHETHEVGDGAVFEWIEETLGTRDIDACPLGNGIMFICIAPGTMIKRTMGDRTRVRVEDWAVENSEATVLFRSARPHDQEFIVYGDVAIVRDPI